ncbi:diguanylate cyclase [Burkholderia sp. lig30]|jgi:diguanylate cyclase (GGDEF)-like protein|uniref:GGDEF domain-containing protein n=1 Tax=Burkholderia sp. lig30 TaxID=1192124 RepID=UPI000461AC8A|nr:GGDEF domain-containing protein [Burkholderia sp. lig30]KDB06300.1 diguanylate cyclase [Burkholderia sp. lig30]
MLTPAITILIPSLTSLIITVLLASLRGSNVPGIADWIWSNVLLAVALPLLLFRHLLPDAIAILLPNILLMAATALYYAGCSRFVGKRPNWPIVAPLAAGVCAGFVYYIFVVDHIPARVLLISCYSGVLLALAAERLLTRPARPQSARLHDLSAAIAIGSLLVHVARAVYFLPLDARTGELLFMSKGNVVLMIVAAATLPMLSMASIMLVHDALLAEARHAADRDFLTGTMSRRAFEHRVERHFPSQPAHAAGLAALILIDIDHFKSINDTYGHAGGDTVLREFGAVVQANLRGDATVGRIGGEEFAVFVPELSLKEALRIAERLRHAVEQTPVITAQGTCRYTISCGVAVLAASQGYEQLYAQADANLYTAKHSGRNRVAA